MTDDGWAVKLLYIVGEFTREALAMEAERRIDGDRVVDVLDRIVSERGTHPQFVRCDNGPEMTSNALRDWCRFSRTGAAFIEPGSPWENPFVESFNSRVRNELLAVEVFSCLTEAKVRSLRSTPARTLTWPHLPTTRSHSRWIDDRGPATSLSAAAGIATRSEWVPQTRDEPPSAKAPPHW